MQYVSMFQIYYSIRISLIRCELTSDLGLLRECFVIYWYDDFEKVNFPQEVLVLLRICIVWLIERNLGSILIQVTSNVGDILERLAKLKKSSHFV